LLQVGAIGIFYDYTRDLEVSLQKALRFLLISGWMPPY